MDREYRPHRLFFLQLLVRVGNVNTFELSMRLSFFTNKWANLPHSLRQAADKRHNVIHITLKCFFNVPKARFFANMFDNEHL